MNLIRKGYFDNKLLEVRTNDGRNFHLSEWLYYTDSLGNRWRTSTDTDGLSTPRLLWFLIPPFGKCWFSGVLHDGAYRDQLQLWNRVDCKWEKATVDEEKANWLIKDAMFAQDCSFLEEMTIWVALELFGWRAFDEDRKNKK